MRIDKWIWHARLAKTRSLAARLCEAGRIELAGATIERPAQPVRIGQILVVSHGGWRRRVEILGLGTRRGPAAEARLLYRELEATRLGADEQDWLPLIADAEEDGA